MKLIHYTTWIPVLGIIAGCISGMDDDSPVQTHTLSNGLMHGILGGCFFGWIIWVICHG